MAKIISFRNNKTKKYQSLRDELEHVLWRFINEETSEEMKKALANRARVLIAIHKSRS